MLSGTYQVPDIYNNIPIYLSHIGLFYMYPTYLVPDVYHDNIFKL